MTKLEERKLKARKDIRKALKNIGNKKVETEAIIEVALMRASMYKYQKVLLMIEILAKLDDGEYS